MATETAGGHSVRGARRRRVGAWSSGDVLRAGLVLLGLYFALQLLWLVHLVLLTGFVGLLFGLGVARGADHLERIHVPRGISAALLVVLSYGALVGVLAIAAPTLDKQFGELRRRLPEAMERVDQWMAANRGSLWGQVFAGAGGSAEGGAGAEAGAGSSEGGAAAGGAAGEPAVSRNVETGSSGAQLKGGGASGPARAQAGAGKQASGGPVAAGESAAAGAGAVAGQGKAAPEGQPAAGAKGGQGAAAGTNGGQEGAPGAKGGPETHAPDAKGGGKAQPEGGVDTVAEGGVASGAQKASPFKQRLAYQIGAMTQYLFPFLSSTVEVLAGLLLITFVAIFFGLDPLTYKRGALHLVPHASRERAEEVLTSVGAVLRRWLATQFIAMLVIGALVSVSLALLGVEAALSLGIIAGVMEFIPTLGAIIAAVPAIAMGFLVSPEKALTVAIVFTLVQLVEGHLLIPMLMKRGMNLPPLLTILGQAIMAVVFGFLGLLVAVPVLAATVTAIKMLYINDVVGDPMPTGASHQHGGS